MSDDWTHPTLADRGVTALGRCACGRERWPEEMLDVRSLGLPVPYLCAACIEDLYRKGVVDRLTFHERGGAPPEWLAAHEAKLRAGPLSRTGLPPAIWGEILARAIDQAEAEAAAAIAARGPPP